MAVDKYTVIAIPTDVPLAEATAENYVFNGVTELSHEIENELKERQVGKKMDYEGGVVTETVSVTFPYDPIFKSDRDLKDAIKAGKQMRIWIIQNAVVKGTVDSAEADGHNATFAYAIPESRSLSVDDEDETIEASFKIKFNSADGFEPKLPDEILDTELATQVAYERVGENEGTLEEVVAKKSV